MVYTIVPHRNGVIHSNQQEMVNELTNLKLNKVKIIHSSDNHIIIKEIIWLEPEGPNKYEKWLRLIVEPANDKLWNNEIELNCLHFDKNTGTPFVH